MNDKVREYLKKIGGMGGAKRKAHPLRIEMARKAANIRWDAKRLSKLKQCQSHESDGNK